MLLGTMERTWALSQPAQSITKSAQFHQSATQSEAVISCQSCRQSAKLTFPEQKKETLSGGSLFFLKKLVQSEEEVEGV